MFASHLSVYSALQKSPKGTMLGNGARASMKIGCSCEAKDAYNMAKICLDKRAETHAQLENKVEQLFGWQRSRQGGGHLEHALPQLWLPDRNTLSPSTQDSRPPCTRRGSRQPHCSIFALLQYSPHNIRKENWQQLLQQAVHYQFGCTVNGKVQCQ